MSPIEYINKLGPRLLHGDLPFLLEISPIESTRFLLYASNNYIGDGYHIIQTNS